MNIQDAWLAGIIEGEGYIGMNGTKLPDGSYKQPVIKVVMTDEDVVRRVHEVAGVGTFREVPWRKDNKDYYKRQFSWSTQSKEGVRHILERILPLLGERRKAKAQEILRNVEAHPGRKKMEVA